ncbi:MAG TPA: XdhC family protein [Rugosimonospora sp.]
MGTSELLARAERLRAQRTPFVLATVVRAQRPTSAKAGDRALVLADGTLDGFVGGTCAESTVRLTGLRLLETGDSTLLRITPAPADGSVAGFAATTGAQSVGAGTVEVATGPIGSGGHGPGAGGFGREDDGERDGDGLLTVANPCLSGGSLEIFLEVMIPPPLVHVFGGAPVARAMAEMGAALGYDIVAGTDPRAPVPPDADAMVVASHGRDEEQVLTAATRAGVPYVALVASRRRGAAVLAGLDLTEPDRARIHTPAGLDIGARTAPEVALSIFAEIISLRPRGATGALIPGTPRRAVPAPRIEAALDPVCGMRVAVTPDALRHEHAGRAWYFCGTGCRDAFADAPDRYAAAA